MNGLGRYTDRYTDEELSRILSQHASGGLWRGGCRGGRWWLKGAPCCIQQAADADLHAWKKVGVAANAVCWFDLNYEPTWTIYEFLSRLEAVGLA